MIAPAIPPIIYQTRNRHLLVGSFFSTPLTSFRVVLPSAPVVKCGGKGGVFL